MMFPREARAYGTKQACLLPSGVAWKGRNFAKALAKNSLSAG